MVEAGSLTAAAARLGLAKTMVSAHMQRLEREVGASLLIRTTRALRLTEAGQAFYDSARRVVADAQAAVEAAASASDSPRGTLRVTAPIDYAAVIAPILVELQQRHAQLQVELLAEDRVMDLLADNIDVAIRVGHLTDSGHRAVRVGTFAEWLVASPALFRTHRWPEGPNALAALPFLALSVLPQPCARTFMHADAAPVPVPVRFTPVLSTNTASALRAAAIAGGGMAVLPDFMVEGDVATGRLVRVLPQWTLPHGGIHAVFGAAPHMPRKTRAFVDALMAHAAGAVHLEAPRAQGAED